MNFITMSDEEAYEAAELLENRTRNEVDNSTVFEGIHPKHGHITIIVPSDGRSIVFGDAFRAQPLVIQHTA